MPTVIRGSDNLDSQPYASFPIGIPFLVWDHLAGAILPDNSGDVKFIKLTAGEDGTGQFNDGLLINESVTGSAPLVVATAEVAVGPLAGLTVPLLNSEGRYVKPGVASGTVDNDKMQQITGQWANSILRGATVATGALSGQGPSTVNGASGGQTAGEGIDFDSANSPNARTGDHTDVKHAQSTAYMRIV